MNPAQKQITILQQEYCGSRNIKGALEESFEMACRLGQSFSMSSRGALVVTIILKLLDVSTSEVSGMVSRNGALLHHQLKNALQILPYECQFQNRILMLRFMRELL